jgi:hypothetical protein
MHGRARCYIPAELVSTDRIMQRWSVAIGSGLPSDEWDDLPAVRQPPLQDELAIVVDRTVLRALPDHKRMVTLWYRTPEPIYEIARRLRLDNWELKNRLSLTLCYMCLKFMESRHPEMLRLLRFDHPIAV